MSDPGIYQSVQWLTIDAEYEGQRIDNFLVTRLKGVPKSRIYRILRKGEVRVNKSRVKPEYKLCAGDNLRIPPIRLAEKKPAAAPSQSLWQHLSHSIVYENDDLLVVNKPSGIAVHGGDGVDLGLIEAMRQIRSDCRYLELVHRLDKETSGCVMIAKKRAALRFLQDKLRQPGGIDKRYCALVLGDWPLGLTKIDKPLLRMELPDGNRIVKVHPEGKASQTQFKVLERFNCDQIGPLTLVEAKPLTGRTHQIRVHAQHAGHSLAGDSKYGSDPHNKSIAKIAPLRLFLHARQLIIPTVTETGAKETLITVEAPLLDDLEHLLKKLRKREAQARVIHI